MKTTATWISDYKSVVNNHRNHSMVLDLPAAKNGSDLGPTALELTLMSLSGCISTIFAVVANKMRINYRNLEVEIHGEKGPKDRTFKRVEIQVSVETEESRTKITKCLDNTIDNCPVGVLFKQAGVEIDLKLDLVSQAYA